MLLITYALFVRGFSRNVYHFKNANISMLTMSKYEHWAVDFNTNDTATK